MRSDSLRVSPQAIDPLSWFARPLVPLSFATVTFAYGVAVILVEDDQVAHPSWDLLGVALMAAAGIFVQVRTRPFRGAFRVRHVVITVALCIAGLGVSTAANISSTMIVQYWWAPVGVALVMATLAPFSSVVRLLWIGGILTVLTGAGGAIAFLGPHAAWPPVSTVVIATSTVLVGAVAAATFCLVVVSRTQALLAGAGVEAEESEDAQLEARNRVERYTVARLGARVAPFLEAITEAGFVTDEDRALAGQLARRLRSDLVERANRSWLDTVAERGRIFVVDPDRRADRMNAAQRSALRGLLVAALSYPGTDAGSLFIELRPHDDGSTAVALSLDIDLPEGRRAMMLAPYYLALQTTVSGMTYDPARELLRFDLRD
ncbi:hypothetical protein BH11ACT2_BH11ACT2_22680 [soil metagenome]